MNLLNQTLPLLLLLVAACVPTVEAFVPLTQSVEVQPAVSSRRSSLAAASIDAVATTGIPEGVNNKETIGNVVILLPSEGAKDTMLSPFGEKSPVGRAVLWDAAQQLARKTTHFSVDTINSELVLVPNKKDDENAYNEVIDQLQHKVDVVVALGLQSPSDLAFADNLFEKRRNNDALRRGRQANFALDCAKKLSPMVGPYDDQGLNVLAQLPWTNSASAQRLQAQMEGLFDRWTSDDYGIAIMLFFNYAVSEVDWVKHSIDATWEKGPLRNAQELATMIDKCGDCVVKCVQDEKCKECLDKLTEIDTRDQVLSYRTIVSYESELLRDFSFCILQKNNIFNCDSSIPELPQVKPITTWRGKPLTKEDGRAILIGHLNEEDAPEGGQNLEVSWEVACGANVAYDQFPSQNQIFYKSLNGKDLWYDPVFRVECLDGSNVWAKRHYKVRDGPEPGTFYFSVLDNGITSNEFWTIAGVADDLSWIVFHYAGAAGAVGQRYLGGLVCTADGGLPPDSALEEIWAALDAAGVSPWDLFIVNNDPTSPGAIAAGPPPLDYFRKDVLAAKQAKKAAAAELARSS